MKPSSATPSSNLPVVVVSIIILFLFHVIHSSGIEFSGYLVVPSKLVEPPRLSPLSVVDNLVQETVSADTMVEI